MAVAVKYIGHGVSKLQEVRPMSVVVPIGLPRRLLLPTRAHVQPFVSPGFLKLGSVHRFVMGQGRRTVSLTATDHVRLRSTAQDSGTEHQYAA